MPPITLEVPQKYLDLVERFNLGEAVSAMGLNTQDRPIVLFLLKNGLATRPLTKNGRANSGVQEEVARAYIEKGQEEAERVALQAAIDKRIKPQTISSLITYARKKSKEVPA